MRDLKVPAYTVRESEQAAGLGIDNKQRGVEEVVKRMEGMSGVQEEGASEAVSSPAKTRSQTQAQVAK